MHWQKSIRKRMESHKFSMDAIGEIKSRVKLINNKNEKFNDVTNTNVIGMYYIVFRR